MAAYFHLIWLLITVISALLAAFKIDPDRRYRDVVIRILTQVKQVTPDNVDEVIDMITAALEGEGLNVNRKATEQIIVEVRKDAQVNTGEIQKTSPKTPSDPSHTHNPATHEH